jgi:hypothetical protein
MELWDTRGGWKRKLLLLRKVGEVSWHPKRTRKKEKGK